MALRRRTESGVRKDGECIARAPQAIALAAKGSPDDFRSLGGADILCRNRRAATDGV
jgi:hypothetical protein